MEVGDLGDRLVHDILILVAADDGKAKLLTANVAIAGVDATNSVVLTLADVRHLVFTDGKPLVVEEVFGIEGALDVEIGPVRGGFVDVEAQSVTIAHGTDEVRAEEFTNSRVVLSAEGNLDDFGTDVAELRRVVHECGDIAILVPDE